MAQADPGRIRSIRLGFAVKGLGDGGLPSHGARRRRSGLHLSVSLGYLDRIFDYLELHDIRMYRMATALAPYATHPELEGFRPQPRECAAQLELHRRVRPRARPASLHPPRPVHIAVLRGRAHRRWRRMSLDVQAELLDGMGLGPGAGPLLLARTT
jgi:UV DNA damage endonuclease